MGIKTEAKQLVWALYRYSMNLVGQLGAGLRDSDQKVLRRC